MQKSTLAIASTFNARTECRGLHNSESGSSVKTVVCDFLWRMLLSERVNDFSFIPITYIRRRSWAAHFHVLKPTAHARSLCAARNIKIYSHIHVYNARLSTSLISATMTGRRITHQWAFVVFDLSRATDEISLLQNLHFNQAARRRKLWIHCARPHKREATAPRLVLFSSHTELMKTIAAVRCERTDSRVTRGSTLIGTFQKASKERCEEIFEYKSHEIKLW